MGPDRLESIKRVRITTRDATNLAQDAKSLGLTESDAMRLGLQLLHRLAQRRRHGAALLNLADVPGDDAVPAWPA